MWAGLLTVAVLCAIDIAGGLVVKQPVAANISGTLALAPALTALSRSRNRTLLVGAVAVLAAAALAVKDGVPWGTGLVRTSVVVASAALSASVAHAQGRQWAQLQDRRQAARTLQAAMLTRLPSPDHLQLTSRYLPASSGEQVGGDWYDAIVDADGCTVLVIGDVVGHDIHAAAAMGQLRGLLRAYAVEGGQSPAQLLERVDRNAARLGLEVLASAVVLRLEQDPINPASAAAGWQRLRWSNAGHPPPMLLLPGEVKTDRPLGQVPAAPDPEVSSLHPQVLQLTSEPDLILGLESTTSRRDHVYDLAPEATLLLYTDGLIERRDRTLDQGTDRLAQAMRECATRYEVRGSAQLNPWLDSVLLSCLQGEQQDDVAVLAVCSHPQHQPRPPAAGPPLPRPGASLIGDLES